MLRPTLAGILREHGPAYRQTHTLSAAQARAWRAIVDCRTAALGGVRERCDGCGAERHVYRSCRNRHCPQCQTRAKEAWRAARLRELLPVPYAHWVFTLPHVLNPLAARHPRWLYGALFESAAATLLELAANPRWLGATPAFSLVLHTWTQDLRLHLHVHALIACGGLDGERQWRTPGRGRGFLFLCRPPRACFAPSSSTRSNKPGAPTGFPVIRKLSPMPGGCAGARCSLTTGWCTRSRRRAGRPRCSTILRATHIGSPSRTSASSAATLIRCESGHGTTVLEASARSRCQPPNSSAVSCVTCYLPVSSASVTTGCSPLTISGRASRLHVQP